MNYKNTLLTSSDYIKTMTSLSDNAWEKIMFPCMRMAQNVELQETIGTCLLNRLKEMVYDGTISDPENESYKFLLDNFIQDAVAYWTLARMVTEISFKLTNLGTIISKDEHVVTMTEGERNVLYQTYMNNASTIKRALQNYLLENKQQYPELCECHCGDVKPNLRSSEDIGLWLGGLYGKNGNF